MDGKKSIYTAMALKGNKIIAVGSDSEIKELKGKNTQLFNLEKRTVIPGITESHTHIFRSGLSELNGELFIPKSIHELLDYIREKVKIITPGEWLYFPNTYPVRLEENRFPSLEELDEVAPENPVYINGAYAGQANSCALKVLNIDENTPEPPASAFIKNHSTGKLTGLLLRCSQLVNNQIKPGTGTIEEIKKGFLNIQNYYNKLGITSVIDGMTSEDHIKALNSVYNDGNLNLRTVLTHRISSPDTAYDKLENMKSLLTLPPEWGKLGFCKITMDGGILTGTAYMRKPYRDKTGIFGINLEEYKGLVDYSADEIIDYIDISYKTGLQMTAHCIGNAATDILLDAYEKYQKKNNIRNRRFSIIHCDFTDINTLYRIKNLNLCILFQPAWHYMDGDILNKVLDFDTMKTFMPYSHFADMEIPAAAGSDHMVKYDPIVSQNPYNPFLALYNMVTRKTRLGTSVGIQFRISRKEALKMYTSKAAYVTFDENMKGTLETGKSADFAVLSDDYFNCPEEKIKDIYSVMTVVGGKIVYKEI